MRVLAYIPYFNAAEYIRSALTSLQSQSVELDILIIDDHSDAPAWATACDLASDRVKVIRTRTSNVGPAGLSNDAFDYALENGYDVVARMDADDISYSWRIERQMDLLRKFPKLIACGTNCHYIDVQGSRLGSSTVPTSPLLVRAEVLAGLRGVVQGSLMIRTEVVGTLKYDEHLRQAEDTDFLLRLTSSGPVSNVNQICYGIRLRHDSLSTKSVVGNVQSHFYVLDRYKRSRSGLPSRTREEFLSDSRARRAINVEVTFLEGWRESLRERNRASILAAALKSPKRLVARLARKVEAVAIRGLHPLERTDMEQFVREKEAPTKGST